MNCGGQVLSIWLATAVDERSNSMMSWFLFKPFSKDCFECIVNLVYLQSNMYCF